MNINGNINQICKVFQQKKTKAVVWRCSVKKVFLKISHTCVWVSFFNKVCLLKKETLAQVFSCEFCEIFKNTFFTKHLFLKKLIYYLFTLHKDRVAICSSLRILLNNSSTHLCKTEKNTGLNNETSN